MSGSSASDLRLWCATATIFVLLCLFSSHPVGASPVDLGNIYHNNFFLRHRRDSSSTSSSSSSSQPLCGNRYPNNLCPSDQPACNGLILSSDNPTCGHDDVYSGARCIPFFSNKPTSCQNLDVCSDFNNDFSGSKMYSESDWTVEESSQQIKPSDNGLEFVLTPDVTGVTLRSKMTMVYGKITTVMKAGQLDGLVSAHVLLSASGDEVDWEYPGSGALELNWWSGADMKANPQSGGSGVKNDNQFHTLELDWQPDSLTWSVGDADGKNMKQIWKVTEDSMTCTTCFLPRTPSYIYINYWNAGSNEWAKGPVDWSKTTNKESSMVIKSIKVECYSGKDANIKGSGNQYQWLTNITDAKPPKASDGKTVSIVDFKIVDGDDSSQNSSQNSSDSSTEAENSTSSLTSTPATSSEAQSTGTATNTSGSASGSSGSNSNSGSSGSESSGNSSP